MHLVMLYQTLVYEFIISPMSGNKECKSSIGFMLDYFALICQHGRLQVFIYTEVINVRYK